MSPVFLFVLTFFLGPAARAADFSVDADILYFSNDEAKVEKLETEIVDDVLRFRFRRDKDSVARELAREELRQGNVCLKQVEHDLIQALEEKEIRKLCRTLFKREAEIGRAPGRFYRGEPVCRVRVEVRDLEEQKEVFLVFRWGARSEGSSAYRRIASVGEEGNAPGEEGKEASLGTPAGDWKGLLKNGSCSLDEDVLESFYDRYLALQKERVSLARCASLQRKQVKKIEGLQKQIQDYVPEEWLKEFEGWDMEALLKTRPQSREFPDLKACRQESDLAEEQWEKLVKAANRLADRHDVPALNQRSSSATRSLSSMEY